VRIQDGVRSLSRLRGLEMPYTVRPLDASTWDAFAELVERNNGIFGGCWCIGYHPERGQPGISSRAAKEARVREGRAHAALVLDDSGAAQGWCQYGSPAELPNIKHRREYGKDAPPRPDWRITCFYVDKKHRGQGIAREALAGALGQIAGAGGGLVEAISEVTAGREAPGRFLFSATVELFEDYGFSRVRQVGKHAWIVSKQIDPDDQGAQLPAIAALAGSGGDAPVRSSRGSGSGSGSETALAAGAGLGRRGLRASAPPPRPR
jgi:ribosomal protein S18 acetylase RimI-like enzyme